MFKHWFRFGDTEVVNTQRTAAYVENGLKPVGAFIRDCQDCPDIWEAVGELDAYQTPVLDAAPWVSAEDVDSADFAGLMAVSVTGLGGSTMEVEINEKVGDGALAGTRRAKSRTIQVTADLVGRTPAATAVGLEWLSAALHPPCSSTGGCNGDVLHLFSACPETCNGQTDPDAPFVTTAIPVESLSVERGKSTTVTTSARTNLVTHPSFELGVNIADGWNADSGGVNGGITREVRDDFGGVTSGTKAQRIVSSAQDNAVGSYAGVSTNAMPLDPGAAYASVDVAALLLPSGHEAALVVECRSAANAVIQTFTSTATTTGTLEVSFTAPAGTTNAILYCRHKGTGTGETTAARIETVWDSAMLVQGAKIDFFTGDTPDNPTFDFEWTGAPNASTSTATGTSDWLQFDHTGSGMDGRVITPLLPGVCDEVSVTWAVSGTGVTVAVLLIDSAGIIQKRETDQIVNGTTSITTRINPTPGFPEDWRTAILVDGDVSANVLVSQRPLLALEDCVRPYRRTFHNVVTIDGPKVVEEKTLGDITDGSSVWTVEWTWVATEPYAWHEPSVLLTDAPGKTNDDPVYSAPGIQISDASTVAASGTACPRPAPTFVSEADNANLSALILPPSAPVLPDPGVMAITQYTRRFLEIPAGLLPAGIGALSWVFENDDKAKLGVRVRVYRKGDDPTFQMEPECSFLQEFYIDYLKADQTLVIDGPGNEIFVVMEDGSTAPAGKNVRGTYGGPFTQTMVGCGDGLVIAVDIPDTYTATGGTEYVNGQPQGTLAWSVDLTRRA